MALIYYLLEANFYLLLFYIFYVLLLQKETFYTLNRYYLILSTVISFVIPLIQASQLRFQLLPEQMLPLPPPPSFAPGGQATAQVVTEAGNMLFVEYIFPYLYALIALAFIARFTWNIVGIVTIIRKGLKTRSGNITFVTLPDHSDKAFSFFNLLFINPALEEKQTVINHELVHIQQRHSLDIVFFEIVRAICWFNPVVYLIRNDIKLLHEYLADEKTTQLSNNKHEYAMFLIRNSFGLPSNQITNHIFNQSILKRRINMLNKQRTTSRARLRLLLALPLSFAMVCISTMGFVSKSYGFIDVYPENYIASTVAPLQDQIPPPPPPAARKKIIGSDYYLPPPGYL
ncbi:MAG: M56 family metallopeptidase [Pedobacter sp.]|nr:MAG: M56 family metallopeptidase [Pedobacter sp.]